MDPRDRPHLLPDGAACTACGAPVPTGGIRILARRDDLTFVELACRACGSAALAMLLSVSGPGGESLLDVAMDAPAPARTSGPGAGRPITTADVEAIRSDLAVWQGDLVGWLDR